MSEVAEQAGEVEEVVTGFQRQTPKRVALGGVLMVGEGLGAFVLVDSDTHSSYKNILYRTLGQILGWSAAGQMQARGEYPLIALARNYDRLITSFEANGIDPKDKRVKPAFDAAKGLLKDLEAQLKENLLLGEVEFEDLGFIFKEGMKVVGRIEGEEIAGVIKECKRYTTWMYDSWLIQIKIVTDFYGPVDESLQKLQIFGYEGRRKLSELSVRELDEEAQTRLTERGKIFRRVTEKASYVQYTGQLIRKTWRTSKAYRADGRVIIDSSTFKNIDDDQHRDLSYSSGLTDPDEQSDSSAAFELTDDDLYRTYPFVHGFSFAAKQWGRLYVNRISEINWRTEAFEQLVLDPKKKKLVRALVEHSNDSFTDIVEGKGGGVIFLLHGPPGEGKTLTAEAVAEILKRPLYSVSVGELGTNPEQLEDKLRKVLDIATIWNAVILIDEADIFLEERDERDIVRNAMVGVFLRLLEYHQGVLFLTTNRVKNIDSAFYSRISIAIHFTRGDTSKRQKIWENLLAAAKIDAQKLNVKELAAHELNGRQIKSVIRQSMTLARADNTELSTEIMGEVIDLTTAFQRELSSKEL